MIKWLRLVILILCLNLQAKAQPFTSVNFSIQAHPDDWQLFWSSRIIADMSIANSKMVFITLTAGDASSGTVDYSGAGAFYLSREIGSMYSARFAADLATNTAPLDAPVASTVTVNGNLITKYVYKNTVNYFLRLPDGDVGGAGFAINNNQSMYKLRNGSLIPAVNPQISAMNVIGNTVGGAPANLTYSWSELVATVRQIINDERVPGTQSWIHTPHELTSYNINDHSDHIHAAYVAQAAVPLSPPAPPPSMSWVGYTGFMDYNSSSLGPNLSRTDHENASVLFSLEVLGITESQYANDYSPGAGHIGWLPMDYFVIRRHPSGTAPNGPVGPPGPDPGGLIKIPMIIWTTSPAFINKDIKIAVSPYETGQLTTVISDMMGNRIADLKTQVLNTDPLVVTIPSPITIKGTYLIETILNNKFVETRKIVVE